MSEPLGSSFSDDGHNTRRATRPVSCPACGSSHLQTKNHAQKLAGILGASVGVLRALSGGVQGVGGGALQLVVSTSSLTRISTAVLGAFVEGALGCAAGAAFGKALDEAVLSNYQCLRCHHSFQVSSRLQEGNDAASR